MERIMKHQAVKELMEEVYNEINNNTKKYEELLKEHPEELRDMKIVKELTHITKVNNKLRNTYSWLELKLIKLEEEA